MGPNALDQKFVARGVEMQFVGQEQLFSGSPIRAKRYRPGIDELDIRSLAREVLDHRVYGLFLFRLLPARNARAKRNEYYRRLWQFAAHTGDERFEVLKNLLGRFPGPKIVAAGPKENHLRFIRENDSLGEM